MDGNLLLAVLPQHERQHIAVHGRRVALESRMTLCEAEQRLARWLLEMYDRVQSDELPVTHELLGLMLGAYRPSITNAMKALQDRGVVKAGRGRIAVLDADALERDACECHELIRKRTASTLREIRNLAA